MDPILVEIDERQISCRHPDGSIEAVAWASLRTVLIETRDSGPFEDDLFWILEGGTRSCTIPIGAQGEELLLERLQQLPGFDSEAVILAMSNTTTVRFICWKRNNFR